MTEILRYVIEYCPFVYEAGRYRFVDSKVPPSFGRDAFLVLASDRLRLRFVRDRAQLFLDLQGAKQANKDEWYSIDLIRRLITEDRLASAELDGAYAAFLRAHLEEVEGLFSEERLPETRRSLQQLARQRARDLFG